MILDLQTMFSGSVASDGTKTGQAVTASAISTNVVDLRQAATPATADEGITGAEMWLIVQVDNSADVASGGASTVTISLESDSTADLATSATVHFVTAAIPKATLVKKYVAVRTKLPSGDYERYLGVRYTVAVANLSAGAFLAYLTPNVQRNISYAAGFTIDS